METRPYPPEQLKPCRDETHTEIIIAVISSVVFFSLSLCLSTVDITELCGDKEAEKNNNRPIDPYFTNFGGVGGKSTYMPGTERLIGPQ